MGCYPAVDKFLSLVVSLFRCVSGMVHGLTQLKRKPLVRRSYSLESLSLIHMSLDGWVRRMFAW